MDGVLIIDKPEGPTSHDIVAWARRTLNERRVGHTGTLDPAASGVLPLVIGKATRLARFLTAGDKSYDAVIRLGFSTDTGDAQGAPIGAVYAGALPARDAIDAALDPFRGSFLQQPPVYSAKKIDGRRSYRLARAAARSRQHEAPGTSSAPSTEHPAPSTLRPALVTVSALTLVSLEGDRVTVSVECSAGFYVRSLAHDLGERLGTGGHLAALRRTRSGDYSLSEAAPLASIEQRLHDRQAPGDRAAPLAGFVPLAAMLSRLSSVVLTEDGAKHARHGRPLGPADLASAAPLPHADEWIRMLTAAGELVGLARPLSLMSGGASLLHPSVVLR
ncbi:MAG: tRNA pseudouridine(55) synthase TruB [Vicinamibacterales bacterium]|nr:tRNA pseudouridine(55) synthase TruB [Vicinamibacterales bacterium]